MTTGRRSEVIADPGIFEPVKGGWSIRGATQVRLRAVDKPTLRSALLTAWLNTAPKRLVEELGPSESVPRRPRWRAGP